MPFVAVGIGANQGDSASCVAGIPGVMARESGLFEIRMSPLYGSKPVGPVAQGDFVNAVCTFQTELSAEDVFARLMRIEQEHGRVRRERWGPRALDLDLLFYGDVHLVEERLTIPHPRMEERGFVLLPLADLAPDWIHPLTGKDIADMIQAWKSGLEHPHQWVWPLDIDGEETGI